MDDQPDDRRDDGVVDSRHLARLSSLDDPTRRRLYDEVAAHGEPVTRDLVSAATGVDRSTVVYHLDRLVDEGLLVATFARPDGRSGPGAGRPAKHYERAADEFTASVPPRDYRLAAELLARAAGADETGTVRTALDRAATDLGRELAATAGGSGDDLRHHLTRQGFEPYLDGDAIRLRNCPFHLLARQHTELICGMNHAMLAATVEAANAPYEARLEPTEGQCCVVFVPR